MYACSRKPSPAPPYSGGRCGAQRPAFFTFALIDSRKSRALPRSSAVEVSRHPAHSFFSFGRISWLTIFAVSARISLMRGSSVGIGFTFICMMVSSAGPSLARRRRDENAVQLAFFAEQEDRDRDHREHE